MKRCDFMTIEFFNERYKHLLDTEDASNVIGVLPVVATIDGWPIQVFFWLEWGSF
ncbi:MAG: hypothetical protein WA869_17715 [Alloacidobacterium sp.]|jgi:hypothetical protein